MKKDAIQVGKWLVVRIMKENGLVAKSGRIGTRRMSKPTQEQYLEENPVKDKFAITEPNGLWCSDNTEMPYRSGKFYLNGIIDAATRGLVRGD